MIEIADAIAELEAMAVGPTEIQTSPLARARMAELIQVGTILVASTERVYGLPIVPNPLLPDGFAAIVGPGDRVVFLDFRTAEERSR